MTEIFKNKKILFVLAHLDDETFGFGGSLQRLAKNNDIYFCIICKGRDEENSKERVRSFIEIMRKYNITLNTFFLGEHYDMTLDNVLTKDITKLIETEINSIKPNIIITNSENDIHQDHKKISQCTKIASRENKNNFFLTELYELKIPNCEPYNTSYYDTRITLSRAEFKNKIDMCQVYSTENMPHIESFEYLRTIFRRYHF